jgi:DNA helicase MCM8
MSNNSMIKAFSAAIRPHILVVGDPGFGKSQLLKACSNVSPRGVYVCGNSKTTAGLTVSLSKGGGGEDIALELGALLYAHNGACCIDEFDKIGPQQQTLLEVMEQLCISIVKGGIV